MIIFFRRSRGLWQLAGALNYVRYELRTNVDSVQRAMSLMDANALLTRLILEYDRV